MQEGWHICDNNTTLTANIIKADSFSLALIMTTIHLCYARWWWCYTFNMNLHGYHFLLNNNKIYTVFSPNPRTK